MPEMDELESSLVDVFSSIELNVGRVLRTKRIMSAFCNMGLAHGYEVCCRKADAPKSTYGEWLYDMGWYSKEGDFYIDAPLVLECEWNGDDLDSDFIKVLLARASHHVYIFSQPDPTQAVDAIEKMIKQIKKFRGSVSGDRYLFLPLVNGKMLKSRLYVHP